MSASSRPRLALRLWAQQHCSVVVGKTCLLEHNEGGGAGPVVLCIDQHGVACVVCEAEGMAPSTALATSPTGSSEASEPWPAVQLHRRPDGSARWCRWLAGSAAPSDLSVEEAKSAIAASSRPALTESGRRAIVRAIHGYYVQHVLEPSVAGFLSILEKQFARSDLYLFELLQNAVDEGALRVELTLSHSPPGLRFSHDGHGFSPLDVNGLASVGMSTKQGKKAVGFMGSKRPGPRAPPRRPPRSPGPPRFQSSL